MNTGELIVEVMKLSIPCLAVLAAVWVVLRELQKRQDKQNHLEVLKETSAKILPLRLNAYERCILFLERISPENLVIRTEAAGKPAAVFHRQLLAEIRAEFEHNMSQQLYISNESWTELVKAKEAILSLINGNARELPPTATGLDLGRRIIESALKTGVAPTQHAIVVMRKDFQRLLKVTTLA
jgi:Na+-transporting NADH:ubiquinone oxidoreductase subunit NqrC